jgi:tetratricopeptide (TPR) repeat protein
MAESSRSARDRAAAVERALERSRTRRPGVVAALIALLAGLGISSSLYLAEKRARLEAAHAAARAEAINRFLSDDLLGAADPSGPGGAHNPTMRDVLARTANHLDGRFANDPETKASIELALGTAYFGLTDYANAEKYRAQALDALDADEGEDSTAALEAQYQLISVLVQTNRLDEASSFYTGCISPRLSDHGSCLNLWVHLSFLSSDILACNERSFHLSRCLEEWGQLKLPGAWLASGLRVPSGGGSEDKGRYGFDDDRLPLSGRSLNRQCGNPRTGGRNLQ